MAEIYPRLSETELNALPSRAEANVYRQLRVLDFPGLEVMHSLATQTRNDKGTWVGEIDFLLFHPQYGIQLWEVKGGGVWLDWKGQCWSQGNHGTHKLTTTPLASVTFNYQSHDTKLSQVEALLGQSGWLTLQRLTFTAFEITEQLLFNGMTDTGVPLDQELCEKLMTVEAKGALYTTDQSPPEALAENSQRHCQSITAELLDANQRLFNEERDKLEKWADDKLLAAEEALKNTKA
ncbi:NERD domain-containing protein [Vreelandella venusta]|uniref:hypothetical protein n=1 Tax=Vreelandella venusta TaxID=44935 RepID=UPI0038514CFB